jgi:chromosomal replication initiator protein
MTDLSAPEAWRRLIEVVRPKLTEQTFRVWLEHAVPVEFTGLRLTVRVADQFAVDWNEKKHTDILASAAPLALGHPCSVRFIADEERQQRSQMDLFAPKLSTSLDRQVGAGFLSRPLLSTRYTFDQFVVGRSNEVAAAAAMAVARAPGTTYNPLFFYGNTGVGKTHLMQAIANEVLARDPSFRMAYLPAEQFTNEYISSLKSASMNEFRRRFRETDLLLVDDIHFLRSKESTQEEFFHTFNALYEAGRQIVMTSDRPPVEIPGIEARLVSRFQWGMVADIDLPDFELRVAILRKKAELDQLQRTIPDDVLRFLAEHLRSTVRELESAVIRLLAYASLKRRDVTVALAQEALKDKLRRVTAGQFEEPAFLTAVRIQEVTARHWGVTSEGLRSKARHKTLTIPRQAAMLLCRELLGLHLTDIGAAFGSRDHSTVIHSLDRAADLFQTDSQFRTRFSAAKSELLVLTRD